MTKRERVEKAYAFEPVDLVPFVPAVYEHKARLAGRRPSEACRDGGLLRECLERELEAYDPDMLVVGIGVGRDRDAPRGHRGRPRRRFSGSSSCLFIEISSCRDYA